MFGSTAYSAEYGMTLFELTELLLRRVCTRTQGTVLMPPAIHPPMMTRCRQFHSRWTRLGSMSFPSSPSFRRLWIRLLALGRVLEWR